LGDILDAVKGGKEKRVAVVNGVVEGVLEVRESYELSTTAFRITSRSSLTIEPNPIDSIDNSTVATIDPIVPGVDVANSSSRGSSASDHRASTLDIIDKDIRALTNSTIVLDALHGGPVKILGANRDTNDQVSQSTAVLLDSRAQSIKLILEDFAASRSPQSQEETGIGVDGSLNGRDRSVGGATLDHGVQTSRRETRGVGKILSTGEFGLEVSLLLPRAICERIAVVEALGYALGSGGAYDGE
jgi:hypothetical protein